MSADLLTLLGSSTTLRKAAATDGGEYAGPCPFCGGKDRFRVWPAAQKPHYWCRSCGERGDAIDWLRRTQGLTFVEAREAAGEQNYSPAAVAGDSGVKFFTPAEREPDQEPPPLAWQAQCGAFVDYAAGELWKPGGAAALRYLRECRGLTSETLRRWRLGFNPEDVYEAPEKWGHEGGKRIWLPRGVVIPCQVDGAWWWSVEVQQDNVK